MSRPRDAAISGLHRVHARSGSWQSSAQPSAQAPRAEPQEPADASEPRFHDECYACPIGSVFASARTVPKVEPETLDRLFGAVHELLGLMRSFVDTLDAAVEAQRDSRGKPSPRVRRIDVD